MDERLLERLGLTPASKICGRHDAALTGWGCAVCAGESGRHVENLCARCLDEHEARHGSAAYAVKANPDHEMRKLKARILETRDAREDGCLPPPGAPRAPANLVPAIENADAASELPLVASARYKLRALELEEERVERESEDAQQLINDSYDEVVVVAARRRDQLLADLGTASNAAAAAVAADKALAVAAVQGAQYAAGLLSEVWRVEGRSARRGSRASAALTGPAALLQMLRPLRTSKTTTSSRV